MTKKVISLLLSLVLLSTMLSGFSTAYAATAPGAITAVSNTGSGIKVKWKKDGSRTGYYVYRKVGSAKGWTKVKTISTKSTVTWTDKNVTNGKKYVYKVCSYKGKKKNNNKATCTIYRLSTPTVKELTSPSAGKLKVTRSKNSAATGFQIRYSRSSKFSSYTQVNVTGTSTSKTISNLFKGQKYYVKVRAYKTVGSKKYYSAFSVYKTCTTKSGSTPDYRKEVIDLATYYYNQDTEYRHDESTGKDEDGNGKIGFDCSGFASFVLNEVMQKYVPTYRLSANLERLHNTTTIYNNGYSSEFKAKVLCKGEIDWSVLMPGDILFFNLPGGPKNAFDWNHCAIYLGDKKLIHSTSSADGVDIRDVDGIYVRYFESAARYLPTKASLININMTTTKDVKLYPDIKCTSGTHKYVVSKGKVVNVACTAEFSGHYVAYATTDDGKSGFVYMYDDGKLK